MMDVSSVSIVVFKPGMSLIPLSSRVKHWGIYIQYENGEHSSYLYHADKEHILNYQTKYEAKEWSHTKCNKLDHLIGYSSQSSNELTHDKMIEYCDKITEDRIFNTIGNNCQEWVKSVLIELFKYGHLSSFCYEVLKGG